HPFGAGPGLAEAASGHDQPDAPVALGRQLSGMGGGAEGIGELAALLRFEATGQPRLLGGLGLEPPVLRIRRHRPEHLAPCPPPLARLRCGRSLARAAPRLSSRSTRALRRPRRWPAAPARLRSSRGAPPAGGRRSRCRTSAGPSWRRWPA